MQTFSLSLVSQAEYKLLSERTLFNSLYHHKLVFCVWILILSIKRACTWLHTYSYKHCIAGTMSPTFRVCGGSRKKEGQWSMKAYRRQKNFRPWSWLRINSVSAEALVFLYATPQLPGLNADLSFSILDIWVLDKNFACTVFSPWLSCHCIEALIPI